MQLTRKFNRLADIEDKFQQTKSYATGSLSGTTDERLEAEKSLEEHMAKDVANVVKVQQKSMAPKPRKDLDDEEIVEITPEMLEAYRQNQGSFISPHGFRIYKVKFPATNGPDPCEFQLEGDITEWRKALNLEIQLQRKLEEEEKRKDKNLMMFAAHNKDLDPIEDLQDISTSSAGGQSLATSEREWEQELMDLPDVDEASELNVLGLLAVSDMRRGLLESYLAPVLHEHDIRVSLFLYSLAIVLII